MALSETSCSTSLLVERDQNRSHPSVNFRRAKTNYFQHSRTRPTSAGARGPVAHPQAFDSKFFSPHTEHLKSWPISNATIDSFLRDRSQNSVAPRFWSLCSPTFAFSPRSCSGGIKAGVPSTVPSIVIPASSSRVFARPKSRICGTRFSLITIFCGLISRCMMALVFHQGGESLFRNSSIAPSNTPGGRK